MHKFCLVRCEEFKSLRLNSIGTTESTERIEAMGSPLHLGGEKLGQALCLGRQGHALARRQLHPDGIAAADLERIVLVRLHHVPADFHRAVYILT